MENRILSIPQLAALKAQGEKIVAMTAYDAAFATLMDEAGIDLILVGDSLGMVVQGHDTTLAVDLDAMVYHTRCARRGCQRAVLAADLPFLSYATPNQAIHAAGRLIREGGAQMVKLEGARNRADIVRALVDQDIPVCGHLGLQPQSIHRLGGFRVQGREAHAAQAMLDEALLLQDAGASLLVLESIPSLLAAEITAALRIPTIGIGAGAACDGQIMVCYDAIGLTPGKRPRFAKNFLTGADSLAGAMRAYADAVRNGTFPGPEHAY